MLTDKVKKTIREYKLINQGDKIIIGVSGGPDSTALVCLLNGLKKEWGLSLRIAHLDHMLRDDSKDDRKYVENLGLRLNIPVSAGEINIKAIASKGSVEEIARNARLGFLFKVARDTKADKIALGHNLDDQAETVLMRLLRGAGLSGLSGISPKKDFAGYTIIRPLIETRRKEIELFLKRKRIVPRRDASNEEDIYLRNKIRNKLLPLLEKGYNANIKEVLANTAESLAIDYDCLNALAAKRIAAFNKKINLKKFKKLHPALQRILIRLNIAAINGNTRRITYQHIREIEDLISNRPLNSIVDLPKGTSVLKTQKSLNFYRRKNQ
ncbi:MAG: tRNA lysidine(34) synthetase TilS [Candidatus Omnitrophica bacterium]|nr:tRNA lysidine(34) synthetase TilS [Candidatus Omnitrophota bacterium]